MGLSEHDPGAKGRRPWNSGRLVGAKRALKAQQVWAVLCGWLPCCKCNLLIWRVGRAQSSVRPVVQSTLDCWP